jgi:DNA-binding winged helix-turn-helix (wHTH) protein
LIGGEGRALSFDDYELMVERLELTHAGAPVPIEPKVACLLAYFLENRGRLIPKDELIAAIWDNRIVSDAAISTAVASLRAAIKQKQARQRDN